MGTKKSPSAFRLRGKHSSQIQEAFSWSDCARAGLSIKLLALPTVIKPEAKWLRWSSQLRKRGGTVNLAEHRRGERLPRVSDGA